MTKTSHLARTATAVAALFVAGGAFAEGTVTPEIGIGFGSGNTIGITGDRQTFTWNLGLGYALENGFGGRLVVIADGDFVRGIFSNDRSFDNFVGAEGTYAFALRDKLNLTAGLGLGRTKEDNGINGSATSRTVTDGIVSAGLQWRFSKHYAMELRVSHLTSSSVTSTTLQAQIPF